jgi:hypothetical protein
LSVFDAIAALQTWPPVRRRPPNLALALLAA